MPTGFWKAYARSLIVVLGVIASSYAYVWALVAFHDATGIGIWWAAGGAGTVFTLAWFARAAYQETKETD